MSKLKKIIIRALGHAAVFAVVGLVVSLLSRAAGGT
jgi:hypothetical protein